MKYLKLTLLILVTAVIYTGCENVDNNLGIEENSQPAYVVVNDSSTSVLEGDTDSVRFQVPVSVQEDVSFTFSVSGSAELGTDWTSPYGDITANEGSGTITYVDTTSSGDETDVVIHFPKDQTQDGAKTLKLTLTKATTASGMELSIGRGPLNASKTFHIADFDYVVPDLEGTYNFTLNSATFGTGSGTLQVSRPANPLVSNGISYAYITSKSAPGIFQSSIPYPFSVRGKGAGVFIAPENFIQSGIYDSIKGSYDSSTGVITFTEALAGFNLGGPTITMTLTPQ